MGLIKQRLLLMGSFTKITKVLFKKKKNGVFWHHETLLSAKVAYFCGQGEHVGAVEGRIQGRHLIKDAACCPHICLLPVRLTLQHLRAEVKPGC